LVTVRRAGPKPEFGELAAQLQDPVIVERAARLAERS
jgi:hypothetical protein